jgi:hypothetical protein
MVGFSVEENVSYFSIIRVAGLKANSTEGRYEKNLKLFSL